MFCPQCGSNQNGDSKYCKLCGANLHAVRQAVASREPEEKFDWGKTWVAEMFLSGAEAERRKAELERQRGLTPEIKRYNEIKAGVITASVGLGVAIVLFVLMQGIIQSGKIPPDVAEIISRVWVSGVIPFLIGIALIVNGLFVSKKIVEASKQASLAAKNTLDQAGNPHSLRSANTTEFIPAGFSVTEETTKHLKSSAQKQ
jgi:hypothetical protein